MPAQQAKSSLADLLQKQHGKVVEEAHEACKATAPNMGYGAGLPAGIRGGIAQLTKLEHGVFSEQAKLKGQLYVRIEGRAKTPKEHNGCQVAGEIVSVNMPLCETTDSQGKKKTFKENYDAMLNEIKKLGVDTSKTTFKQLDGIFAALVKKAPHYRFSTNGFTPKATPANPKPTEMVFTRLHGYCEAPSSNGESHFDEAPPAGDVETALAPASPPPDEPTTTTTAEETSTSIDSLVAAASGSPPDEAAMEQLTKMALEAGMTQAEVDAAPSWADIAKQTAEKGTSGSATSEEWSPNEGDVYLFRPFDPKKKAKAEKGVECKVTKVDKAAKTVQLQNLNNPKLVYAAKWDDLEAAA